MIKITDRGLQLLNLPSLPEDESPLNLLELMEKQYATFREHNLDMIFTLPKVKSEKDKTINLYPLYQHTGIANWIDAMAMRYNVRSNDVICAMWAIAKDSVWAKLEQDAKEKKGRK